MKKVPVSHCHNACHEPRSDARSVQERSKTMMSETGINCSDGPRMLVHCTETDRSLGATRFAVLTNDKKVKVSFRRGQGTY